MRADGNIEFLGRQDRQVKINGKRVELDEIEARMRATGLVQDAAVVCPPGAVGHRHIIGFVTAARARRSTSRHLRRMLREDLPDHMIPAVDHAVGAFPAVPDRQGGSRADCPSMAAEVA